jgi:hypothetical protein
MLFDIFIWVHIESPLKIFHSVILPSRKAKNYRVSEIWEEWAISYKSASLCTSVSQDAFIVRISSSEQYSLRPSEIPSHPPSIRLPTYLYLSGNSLSHNSFMCDPRQLPPVMKNPAIPFVCSFTNPIRSTKKSMMNLIFSA